MFLFQQSISDRFRQMTCISTSVSAKVLASQLSFPPNDLHLNFRQVPFGQTVSYSQLALLSGKSGNAARAVGTVMANNNIWWPFHE
jgi:O6-methylguanine-DNA--protein-cysteine methyltransferase